MLHKSYTFKAFCSMHTNKKHSPHSPLQLQGVHNEHARPLYLTCCQLNPETNMVIRSDFMEEYVSTQ